MNTRTSTKNFHHVIILGCGPSSISAAVQLTRAGIPILVITKEIGGLIQNANLIENLVGYSKGVTGKNLASILVDTLERFKIPVVKENVLGVHQEENLFVIKTEKQVYRCEYLVVGTGTIPNKLHVPGEEEGHSAKLLYYDIYKFTDIEPSMTFGIVGGGDAAYDYALNLSKHPCNIEILQRRKKSSALSLLQRRVQDSSNISIITDIRVKNIELNPNNLKLKLESTEGKVIKEFDRLFITVGRSPNISFLSQKLSQFYIDKFDSNRNNYREYPEQIEKIWFIGDVKNQKYRQLAIAMGDGIKAAMQITAMFHK